MTPSHIPLTALRSKTDSDEDHRFAATLFRQICAARLQLDHLPHELADSLVAMQWRAFEQHHAHAYDQKEDLLIVHGGEPVGRLILGISEDAVVIDDIAVLPRVQGRGIATGTLRSLQDRVRGEDKSLQLHVDKESPALRLYQKLGFAIEGETDVQFFMTWRSG